jgi:hypothetical protein
MTAIAQMPIGKIISMSSYNSQASKIIDAITYRLPFRGVDTTYKGVVDDLFKLRLDILNQTESDAVVKISLPLKSSMTQELNNLVSEILPIYSHISKKMVPSLPKTESIETISLQGFKTITAFLPYKQAVQLADFVEDSLQIDFALIAFDCFASNLSTFPIAVSDDLYLFLKLAFERYAARAAFFKIWNPDDFETETQMLRSIKIVHAKMETDAGIFAFSAMSLNDVKNYFENTI